MPLPRLAGVTSPRQRWFGASTPWNRSRLTLGLGTSTAKNDTLSRLVPALERGAGVVTTRAAVDYVVTEYGIAKLRGRTPTSERFFSKP